MSFREFVASIPPIILGGLSALFLTILILLTGFKFVLFIYGQWLRHLEEKPGKIGRDINNSVDSIIRFLNSWEHAKVFPPIVIRQLRQIPGSNHHKAKEVQQQVEKYIPSAILQDKSTLDILNQILELGDLIDSQQQAQDKWQNQQAKGDPEFIKFLKKLPFVIS